MTPAKIFLAPALARRSRLPATRNRSQSGTAAANAQNGDGTALTQSFPTARIVWTYRAIYQVNDARVGVWSQSVSVAVPA